MKDNVDLSLPSFTKINLTNSSNSFNNLINQERKIGQINPDKNSLNIPFENNAQQQNLELSIPQKDLSNIVKDHKIKLSFFI